MADEPQYRALLIGIDNYPTRPLRGCVNDIDGVQELLLERVKVPKDRIRRLASPHRSATHSTDVAERLATLANIREELAALARETKAGERVFIYYSGHGARAEFRRANGRTFHREALVPADVDETSDRRLLSDYELNGLLHQIALRSPSVTLVLDCCHAAGATRSPGLPGMLARSLDVQQDLGWAEPLLEDGAGDGARGYGTRGYAGRGDGQSTVDACHVIAASLNHELAVESTDSEGVRHGLLTAAFLLAMSRIPEAGLHTVSWARIWQEMRASVTARNAWQNLWMSGNPGRAVLAGPPVDGDPGISVHRTGDAYELDAGLLASVGKGTRFAVYGERPLFFSPVGSPADLSERCGLLCVTEEPRPSSATATAEGARFDLPVGARARIIEVGRPARLRCAILPDAGATSPESSALAAALSASPLVTLVDVGQAQVRLEQVDGHWLVTDDQHDKTAATALVVLKPADLTHVRAVLEHYYHYALPLRMAETVPDLPGELELRVLACDRDLSPQEAQEADLPEAGTDLTNGARVCFRVRNHSTEQLRVTLLNSAASGRVQALGDQVIGPSSGYVFWAGSALGKPFAMTLPTGKQLGIDRLTAIGTTALDRDLGYLRVTRKFADILSISRGEMRDTTKDFDGDDDTHNNPPVERWTSASAIVKTRAR